jgi:hypothetical protein
MTYKATIVYQAGFSETVMTREIPGVEKIERTWEKIGGKNTEVLRVYTSSHIWSTWGIGSVLNINMTPEIKAE